MIIGRSNESTIVLSDPMVSRSHARISLEKGQWILEDLGSANGTISDGQKIKRKSLRLGDSFQVGLNVFRVVVSYRKSQAQFIILYILSLPSF